MKYFGNARITGNTCLALTMLARYCLYGMALLLFSRRLSSSEVVVVTLLKVTSSAQSAIVAQNGSFRDYEFRECRLNAESVV